MRNDYVRQKGFSLAEAMLAVVVLGITASSLIVPYTSGAAARCEGMNRTLEPAPLSVYRRP